MNGTGTLWTWIVVLVGLLCGPSVATAQCTALTCDVPRTDRIETVGDTDCFSFSVTEGEVVAITVVNDTPIGNNFTAVWQLVDKNGAAVNGPCGGEFAPSDPNFTCGPLAAAGSPYRLEVADGNDDDTGTYRVRLQRLTAGKTCEDVPLTCDTVATDRITDPLDTDLLSFTAADGELVSITVTEGTPSDGNFAVGWRLVDATGQPTSDACGVFDVASFDFICGPLSAAGSPYRLEVGDLASAARGTYRARFQRLTATEACDNVALPCGVTIAGQTNDPLATNLYSFRVPDGEEITVNVTADVPTPPSMFTVGWRLLDGTGNPVEGDCGIFAGSVPDVPCGPLPAAGNPYRLEIGDQNSGDPGSYSVEVVFQTSGCPVSMCVGDCDGLGTVSVDELVRGVNIALATALLDECRAFDSDDSQTVTVDELVTGVSNALNGCQNAAGVSSP